MPELRILFLITARGGSKSIPGKNLREIGGLSLVAFKAIAARKSRHCARLVVSTDSAAIQAEAVKYGAEAPFTRPAELATDTASSLDVITHALEWLEQKERDRYDAVMLLEPSSPFARAEDFDHAVELMIRHDASLVVGVREMEVNSVFVGPMDERGRISGIIHQIRSRPRLRRQDLAREFTMNGALYLFKWDFFKQHHALYQDPENSYGYLMDPHYSIEIDEPRDLHWAEFLVERGYIDLSHWR